jgi:S1-C subfamily serine protease
LDGQVVRLERIKDLADRFVRVRLTRIDTLDLNLFEFDYDLTFVVFFMNAEGKVYARYGGRDGKGPDERQSLEGLRYTMTSVLDMHQGQEKAFAPRDDAATKYVRQIPSGRARRGCYHCHNVRETLNADLKRRGKWERELAYRYPLPDNLGLILEVNRGNVIDRVTPESPAAHAGLRKGDVLQRLNSVPIHSQGDAMFALDRAPKTGQIALSWKRGGQLENGTLALPAGWRKGDITWRPSLMHLVPSLPVYGNDLSVADKQALGLPAEQMAFRQKAQVNSRAKAAGVEPGDVIVGIDGRTFRGMTVDAFHRFFSRKFLVGDRVQLDLFREGKRMSVPLTLR